MMPRMRGLELLEKVRALRPRLPVIVCSGYADLLDRHERTSTAPADAYLHKPVALDELLTAVRCCLE